MNDYIRRGKALLAINEFYHDPKVDIVIRDLPAENVRPVICGKWKQVNALAGYSYLVCDNCGYKEYNHVKYTRFSFCPNCGADMR